MTEELASAPEAPSDDDGAVATLPPDAATAVTPKPETRRDEATIGRRQANGWRRFIPWRATTREAEPRPNALVTFSDLVRAHRAWEQELYAREVHSTPPDKAVEREFLRRWRQFEARHGRIDDAFWSVRDASAVALTIREKPPRWRREPELVPRFHRATDWATRDEPDIAAALDACETLAVRAEEILRGPSELIALRRIKGVASHLLGFVDREWGRQAPRTAPHQTPPAALQSERRAFVATQKKELGRIERFYNRTGNGQARVLFFWGMVDGLLALVGVTTVSAVVAWLVELPGEGGANWGDLRLFVVSIVAGALGAILSVLSRMASLTGTFSLDHEIGRKNIRWIGIYRPFVGGIYGLATFLMLASGVLQPQNPDSGKQYAYFGALALFSGFFERFTKLGPTGSPTALDGEERRKSDTS